MQKITVFILGALLNWSNAGAQSVHEVEDEISYFSRNIDKWDSVGYGTDIENGYDSLRFYNKEFLGYLSAACKSNPETINADFLLSQTCRLKVVTSDDRKFRIYWWNVGGGGSARSYNSILQYKGAHRTGVKILNDESRAVEGDVGSGSFYPHLYTIHKKSGQVVYLAVSGAIVWNGAGTYSIKAYAIEDGRLKDRIKVFKTRQGQLTKLITLMI